MGFSTEGQLKQIFTVFVSNFVYNILGIDRRVDVAYTDFSKAFDVVNYDILLQVL